MIGLLIGLTFSIGAVLVSGHATLFWNLPSIFIIVGGTTGAFIMAYPLSRLKTFGPIMKKAFSKQDYDIGEDINSLVSLAETAKKEGLLSLEDAVGQYSDDPFLGKGIQLIVDGADEERLRNSLEGATYFMKQRHKKGAEMLSMIAATAPSLGLLGTYVGLIPMLSTLDNPTTLGPMMALELVSSFYGAFIAYVIFSPLAKRLKSMNEEEVSRRELLIEGLVAIQQGKNPRLIKEDLVEYANIDPDAPEKNSQKHKLTQVEMPNQI